MSTHLHSSTQAFCAELSPSDSVKRFNRLVVSRRVMKIGFAVALCSAGIFGIFSDSTYISSSDAVVSADVVNVLAPINGTISSLPLRLGSLVENGQVLGDVDNPRSDRQHLDNLLTAQNTAKSTFDALTTERSVLQAQEKALLKRDSLDGSAVASRLSQQSTAASQTLLGLQQALAEANIEFHRGEQLHLAGIISDAVYDKLLSEQRIASQTLAAQQAVLASLQSETVDAMHGILTEPGDASDVSYSRQRADEIAIKLAENAAALTLARGQSKEAIANVDKETVRENLMRQSEIHAPIQGSVWKINTTDGQEITGGSSVLSLVDCSQQFVLVQIPQDRVPNVAFDREARIRLAGESKERAGTVVSVSGDVLKLQNERFAAVPFEESSQQMATVLVMLKEPSVQSSTARDPSTAQRNSSQCLVGRAARVLIPAYSTNLATRWIHEFF